MLSWIGFLVAASHQAFIEDTFVLFDNLRVLTEKGICMMASNFSSHTHINGRMSFGTRRIKYIKAFTQWVQDFYRVSGLPSIVGLYEVTLKHQLDRASARADIRK